jgi:hypothetical protein
MHLTTKDLNPLHLARRAVHKWQRMRLRPLFREHEEKLAELRDAHAGERCFIIGNGPSLNKMDLTPLADEFTFGVNAIYLHHDRMGFRPTFYCVVDPNVAEDRVDEINRLEGSLKFIPRTLAYCIRPAPDVLYIHYTGHADKVFPQFSHDAARVVYWGSTVTYVNLQLAYHMGFRTVYLIGMDHTYRVPEHARGVTIVSRRDDPNHFHPDYFGKGYRWSYPRLDRMEQSLARAREEFEADGRRVINATVGGKLEVFPRENYDRVIGKEPAG